MRYWCASFCVKLFHCLPWDILNKVFIPLLYKMNIKISTLSIYFQKCCYTTKDPTTRFISHFYPQVQCFHILETHKYALLFVLQKNHNNQTPFFPFKIDWLWGEDAHTILACAAATRIRLIWKPRNLLKRKSVAYI